MWTEEEDISFASTPCSEFDKYRIICYKKNFLRKCKPIYLNNHRQNQQTTLSSNYHGFLIGKTSTIKENAQEAKENTLNLYRLKKWQLLNKGQKSQTK